MQVATTRSWKSLIRTERGAHYDGHIQLVCCYSPPIPRNRDLSDFGSGLLFRKIYIQGNWTGVGDGYSPGRCTDRPNRNKHLATTQGIRVLDVSFRRGVW